MADSRQYGVMVVGALMGALAQAAPLPPQPPAGQPKAVAAAPAAAKAAPAAPRTIRVLVVADQEGVLAAQMAGRINQITVQLGSSFKAGQPLVRFNCDEQNAHLKMADAEFYGARQTYESKVKLQALQSVSELEVQQAAAAAEKLKGQIELYQAQLRQCTISAPFSGRVTRLLAKPFESVNVGQALIEIVNDRKLKARLNVPSLWLQWLKPGAAFTMRVDETGKSYAARILRINGRVDAVSQSVEVEGEVVGNPDNLLPGMSGVATFAQAQQP